MKFELNIGLDEAGEDNDRAARAVRVMRAKMYLRDYCEKVISCEVVGDIGGAEEPCLYAEVLAGNVEALGFALSEALRQECVAFQFPNGNGALVGPRAAAWGEFNPEYFRRPEVV